MFTNVGLVKYAEYQLEKNSPYWFGTFGNIATKKLYEEKLNQYPEQYKKWSVSSFSEQFGQKVHDCAGLVKGYFMTTSDIDKDGIVINPGLPSKYNSKYDLSADMTEKMAKEKGSIKSIPEIPGLIVWKPGHEGIYVGKGYVIEERGHSYGTVKTNINDRPWEEWLKHPNIEYVSIPDVSKKKQYCKPVIEVLRKGDHGEVVKILQFCLNLKGYSLEEDGSFGNRTEAAVIDFQKKYNIKNLGVVGVVTWNKLLKG